MGNGLASRLVSKLENALDWTKEAETIEDWTASGRVDLLYEVAAEIELHTVVTQTQQAAFDAITKHILKLLATTPGIPNVETLLRILLLRTEHRLRTAAQERENWRPIASMLAACQPQDALVFLFGTYRGDEQFSELLIQLAQEMVLRGAACEDFAQVVDLRNTMLSNHHPLAYLPLHLTGLESDLSLPQYSRHAESYSIPFGPHANMEYSKEKASMPMAQAPSETTTGSDIETIATAVNGWVRLSNGRYEVRVFASSDFLTQECLTVSFLLSLGLDSLRGGDLGSVKAKPIAPSCAFKILFAAASFGGAYSGGLYGAYGRLAAWHSIAGLVGEPPTDDVDTLAELGRQAAWLYFEGETLWFNRVAWDLGVLALRPDGRSLGVLAATDSD